MTSEAEAAVAARLRQVESGFRSIAGELAVLLVHDRPARAHDRPGAARTFFAQRCVSDEEISQTIEAVKSAGAYIELFTNELDFMEAISSGQIAELPHQHKLVYNGVEGGIAHDGFAPGRKGLLPAVADAYGILFTASNAQACVLGRHKFHYFSILRSLGLSCPPAYHYLGAGRWAGGLHPQPATRVIAKSTFENWSVGVAEDSVFDVDSDLVDRVEDIFQTIGQPVCVQEFIPGREVCIPLLEIPHLVVTPPVDVVLAKAPNDPTAFMTLDDNLTGAAISYSRSSLDDHSIDAAVALVKDAFHGLELGSFARIDVRVDEQGTPWVIDVGVCPGVSRASAAFASAELLGFAHDEFIRIALGSALASRNLI